MSCIAEKLTSQEWSDLQAVFGFVGNELLVPMNRSGNLLGLDLEFWNAVPTFGEKSAASGLERLAQYANVASSQGEKGLNDPDVPGMMNASVEYTRLFIGPPSPAANPWETSYDAQSDPHMGFGRATVQMQNLLHEDGLVVNGEGNQFADHIGIELLYLSSLCEKAAKGLEGSMEKACWFAMKHPGKWITALREKVDDDSPDGYYSALLQFADETLRDAFA